MFVIDFAGAEGSPTLTEEDENFQSIPEGSGDGALFFPSKAFSEKREEKKKDDNWWEMCYALFISLGRKWNSMKWRLIYHAKASMEVAIQTDFWGHSGPWLTLKLCFKNCLSMTVTRNFYQMIRTLIIAIFCVLKLPLKIYVSKINHCPLTFALGSHLG